DIEKIKHAFRLLRASPALSFPDRSSSSSPSALSMPDFERASQPSSPLSLCLFVFSRLVLADFGRV
ncbi:hypothetical protein ACLOJK_027059, partial [Asimina triloba]